MIARAQQLTRRLERECDGHADRDAHINRAFLLTVGRAPDLDELTAARQLLGAQPSRYPGLPEPERHHRALADFCQMMLASNAFLYIE
jgi:hypothetical protein